MKKSNLTARILDGAMIAFMVFGIVAAAIVALV